MQWNAKGSEAVGATCHQEAVHVWCRCRGTDAAQPLSSGRRPVAPVGLDAGQGSRGRAHIQLPQLEGAGQGGCRRLVGSAAGSVLGGWQLRATASGARTPSAHTDPPLPELYDTLINQAVHTLTSALASSGERMEPSTRAVACSGAPAGVKGSAVGPSRADPGWLPYASRAEGGGPP